MRPPETDTTPRLPAPPPGKSGWPWDQQVPPQGAVSREQGGWPRITIVTPSFNQGRFIESTIRGILLQGYPNLEYIVVDGGSTDETIETIRKYEPWITHWVSEPDQGMYDALNKGFGRGTGDIMAWSPTGDLYKPGALWIVAGIFRQFAQIEWLTSAYKVKCNEAGEENACYKIDGFNRTAFRRGRYFPGGTPYAKFNIQQQSTFWRRSLWQKSGGKVDDSFRSAGDFELWTRFYSFADLYAVNAPIGIFRTHQGQDSVHFEERSLRERELAFSRTGGRHLNKIECLLRNTLLRKRPFSLARYLPLVGYPAPIVEWNHTTGTGAIRQERIL
jgi:glycosyltransferase involved in cell wall biosynthesis